MAAKVNVRPPLVTFGDTVDGHQAVLEFEVACGFYSVVSFSHS